MKKIKQSLVKIYNHLCLSLFKPSCIKYRFLNSRRRRNANKEILQNLEEHLANGRSFQELIPLVCKQYNTLEAIHALDIYFDYFNTSADCNEDQFCGVYLYFKLAKFTEPTDPKALSLHELDFDLWVVEKSDDTFDLHLLIKCAYYESINKPLKSITILRDSLKRDASDLELALVRRYIEYASDFYDDEVIDYFLNDRIINQCLDDSYGVGHEIILIYLTTLLRQDDLSKFFTIYDKFALSFDLPRQLDIQRKFEFQLTKAYINSFQFDKARSLNGLLVYSINSVGYFKNWHTMARTNFYLGNSLSSKAYFTLIILCFGLNKVSGTDMKMLLGVTFEKVNSIREAYGRLLRGTPSSKVQRPALTQIYQTPSFDRSSPDTIVNHLKLLFDKGEFQQAKRYYEEVIYPLPGDLLRETFLCRRVEGLKKNNVVSYFNTYRQHPTVISLLRNIPNFETKITPEKGDNILILAHFGPGDELIASSSYPKLIAWAENNSMNISIATQSRLISIMRQTFPEITFIENERTIQGILNHASTEPSIVNSNLPPTNLLSFTLDAKTQKSLSQYDQVSSTPLICSQFHEARSARKIAPSLNLLKYWKTRLTTIKKSRATRLVGLSWRSSLVTKNRSVYYPDLSDLLIFEDLENVTFVNLQVKLSNREKLFFDQRNFDFIDFPDLCLYNDFDNTSALISNLDASVSPVTTMGELSAALYVPTIILSPTLDSMWRLDDSGKELMFGTQVKIVHPNNFQSCTEAAKEELIRVLAAS